jgi:hypothetical protein
MKTVLAATATALLLASATACSNDSASGVDNSKAEAAASGASDGAAGAQINCPDQKIGSPSYEEGAQGAPDPETAAADYVEDSERTEVEQTSNDSATVVVYDGDEVVAEIVLFDHGDGWLVSSAVTCS